MMTVVKRTVLFAGLTVSVAVIGLLVAMGVHEYVWPPWKVTNYPKYPGETDQTVVLFEMEFDNASKDVLYQVTDAGNVYSFGRGDWKDIGLAPNGEEVTALRIVGDAMIASVVAATKSGGEFGLANGQWAPESSISEQGLTRGPIDCVSTWPEMPARQETVVASFGLQLDRPLAMERRCYVFYSDGSMVLTSRVTNAFELMNTLTIGVATGAMFGFGAAIIVMVVRARRVISEKAT